VGPTGDLDVFENNKNRFPLPGLEGRTVKPVVLSSITKKAKVNTSRMRMEMCGCKAPCFLDHVSHCMELSGQLYAPPEGLGVLLEVKNSFLPMTGIEHRPFSP
jgi:hypothetical protein